MKPACRECWDPVDRDGAELCDWCAMTPQQRAKKLRRSGLLIAALVASTVLLIWTYA